MRYKNHADANLNAWLQKKKSTLELSQHGFKVMNCKLEKFITYVQNRYYEWYYPPVSFKGNIKEAGRKDKNIIFSTYGKTIQKWKFINGNAYKYSYESKIDGEKYFVFVFTDKDRNVIGEYWTCEKRY